MSLKNTLLAAVAFTAATIGAARAEPVELVVQYTQPQIFDGVFERLKAEFEAQNPDITVTFRAPLPNYARASRRCCVRRRSVTCRMSTISASRISVPWSIAASRWRSRR